MLAERSIGLVWRELSPQHFDGSPDGSYPGRHIKRRFPTYLPGKSRCAPAQRPARDPARAQRLDELELGGLPVLRIWNLSSSQWDTHLESRTPHLKSRGGDCTHYCFPGGVLEAWSDATLLWLAAQPPARTARWPPAGSGQT